MDYIQISINIVPYTSQNAEILMAWMGQIGYESFLENETGFEAYIPAQAFDDQALHNLHHNAGEIVFNHTQVTIPDQNWNEVWESNYFKPIIIGNECVVRSSFHQEFPHIRHQIVIEPKMAFGTGHHETTAMVMEHLLEMDLTGKRVLDMGCGTGILGILAAMRGATEVVGIDIDHWCTDNSEENCRLNHIFNMEIFLGDASRLAGCQPFNIIVANINRNILLEDIPAYNQHLLAGGTLVLSGFYSDDLPVIHELAQKEKLTKKMTKENNHWVAVAYEKTVEK